MFATWSPEQISNTTTLGKVSFKTIYNWLYQGKLCNVNSTVLRQRGKRQKPAEKRGKFAVGTSIHQRPREVKSRETFGHWELDTMVSSRGKSKGCFATFVERKSRLYTALKISDRTADSMEKAIANYIVPCPQERLKQAQQTVEKNLPAIVPFKKNLIYRFSLLIPILLGREVAMKTPMGCSENSFQREPTLPRLTKKS